MWLASASWGTLKFLKLRQNSQGRLSSEVAPVTQTGASWLPSFGASLGKPLQSLFIIVVNSEKCSLFPCCSNFPVVSCRFWGANSARLPPPNVLIQINKSNAARNLMKFTGLILICASSCLALILPAIGVVQFPKIQQAMPDSAVTGSLPGSFPVTTQNPPIGSPNSPSWTQAPSQREFLPNTNSMPASPFPAPAPFPVAASSPPSLAQPSVANPINTAIESKANGQKLGMGIWLLLAPVCLIGLAMWTFSPNPSGVKPKFTK